MRYWCRKRIRVETDVKMSIDQQDTIRNSQAEPGKLPTDSDRTDKRRKFELSISQVIGGALAAMTAAVLGSRLGSTGTVVGAAAASVVAAVSGAMYTAWVRHTHEKVRTVLPGLRRSNATPATVQLVSDSSQPNAASAPAQQLAGANRLERLRSRIRVPWKSAGLGALLAFGIAAAAVTGLELISGHALSGDDGTTITQVSRPDAADDRSSREENRSDGQQERTRDDQGAPEASSESTDSGQPAESPSPEVDRTSSELETRSPAPSTGPSSGPPTSAPAPTEKPSR